LARTAPVQVGNGPGVPEVRQGDEGDGVKVDESKDAAADNRTQPNLGIHFIIALQGVYPSRN